MMTRFGLDEDLLAKIVAVLEESGHVDRVVIYGSRARGSFKNYSDIDIAVHAPDMTHDEFLLLCSAIDDLPIIFRIDVVHADRLADPKLMAKIHRDGVSIFDRRSASKGSTATRRRS